LNFVSLEESVAYQKTSKLNSRPKMSRPLGSTTTGLRRTGLETERDGILYVPKSFDPKGPTPLIVTLHGAGGNAEHSLYPLRDLADHSGSIILAPESQGSTWDLLLRGFGEDVYWIDEALSDVFALYAIDPKRVAIAGFSDGASYALSLGLCNGDLFSHILAFSPGFASFSKSPHPPKVFISHGASDTILPIKNCSHKIVPQLKQAGVHVTFHEFLGGHTIPQEIAKEAFRWFLGEEHKMEVLNSVIPSENIHLSHPETRSFVPFRET